MTESVRERKILDDLVVGKSITISGSVYRIENEFSRNLLQHLRTLSDKTIAPPISQEKAIELIKASQKIIVDGESQFDSAVQHVEALNQTRRTLRIKRLTAHNFRGLQNYNTSEFTYNFKAEPYLLTGVNGAGKTSVLNAVVWCLTGHLLWDRTMPSVPPKVDLKVTNDSSTPKTIKNNWPIQVSIPKLDSIGAVKPYCWVELELIDGEENPLIVRREYNSNRESVIGMDSLDYLSIELALLMPGKVNHIQLNKDSQIGSLFFQISGLELLNKYGVFTSSNGMGRALTAQINKLHQESEALRQQLAVETRTFNENLPFDMKEAYEQVALTERNSINRANFKIKWLKEQELLRLNQLSSLFNISEESDAQELVDLGKSILIANENLKETRPLNWSDIQSLLKAADEWDDATALTWSNMQDIIKRDLNLAIEWYMKIKQTENLRLKIVAAQLLSDNELDICPLCEQELGHDHFLKSELNGLKKANGVDRSIGEILSTLTAKLEKALPEACKRIKTINIKDIIINSFESNIGRYLKGKVGPIREIGIQAISELLVFDDPLVEPGIDYSSLKLELADDLLIIEQFEAFEKKLDEYNKKILMVSWAALYLKKLTLDLESVLGYTDGTETTMLGKLAMANSIATAAKPVRTCVEQLEKVLILYQQKKEVDEKLTIAKKTKDACVDLSKLALISNELLLEDLKRIETELYETYKKLYGGEDLILKKIIPTGSGRNFSLSFWVGFKDMLVEAGGILNASRIRALLWSYVFSLAKVGTENSIGDWLDFMIIDEPLTSLDQEHQRNFAQIVFNANDQKQVIVASHDLRWPRELQNLSQSHSIYANFINCYGISSQREVVRLSEWIGQLDVKWKRWADDNSDIESGRDYVAGVREWCEDELKDILIWAPSPSLARDTLGDLIKKLENAHQNEPLYQMIQVSKLLSDIRLIEVDLQNSHHGCAERRNIMQNEVRKVNKHMKKDIPDSISAIRSTLYHRRGMLTII